MFEPSSHPEEEIFCLLFAMNLCGNGFTGFLSILLIWVAYVHHARVCVVAREILRTI